VFGHFETGYDLVEAEEVREGAKAEEAAVVDQQSVVQAAAMNHYSTALGQHWN